MLPLRRGLRPAIRLTRYAGMFTARGHRRVGDVDLDSVAVELDFVNPAFPIGRLLNRRGQRGLDESGEGRLHADRRRAFC